MGLILAFLSVLWVGLQVLFGLIVGSPMSMSTTLGIFFPTFSSLNIFLDVVLLIIVCVVLIVYFLFVRWLGIEFFGTVLGSFKKWVVGFTAIFSMCSGWAFGLLIVARILVTLSSVVLSNNWAMIGNQESSGATVWLIIGIIGMLIGG